MESKRIGNDLLLRWKITRKGKPEDFSGKTMKVQLLDPRGKPANITYNTSGNTINVGFLGRYQKVAGIYSLKLVLNENKSGQTQWDEAHAVRLLRHVCKDGIIPGPDITREEIDIHSDIDITAPSLTVYENEMLDTDDLTEYPDVF